MKPKPQGCTGCDGDPIECASLWPQQRKCCPDCTCGKSIGEAASRLRGQLAAAREALGTIARSMSPEAQGRARFVARDALTAIDADEPFIPKRLLDGAEARMRETDRQLEQGDPYKRGYEAGWKARAEDQGRYVADRGSANERLQSAINHLGRNRGSRR